MPASPASSASNVLGPSAYCASCGAGLSAGARYCHRCGTAFGEVAPPGYVPEAAWLDEPGTRSLLPWGVGFVAILAVVALLAGRSFGSSRTAPAAPPQTPAFGAPGAGGPAGAQRAPDISSMSPQDRALRLYERVMTYAERGSRDSLIMFAPMALAAHELLENISADERYHAGRIAEAAGLPDLASAQADTILATAPDHLLGLILGASAARLMNEPARAVELEARLVRVAAAERARGLSEYQQHAADIERELTRARPN
jgi:hypothetical protein